MKKAQRANLNLSREHRRHLKRIAKGMRMSETRVVETLIDREKVMNAFGIAPLSPKEEKPKTVGTAK